MGIKFNQKENWWEAYFSKRHPKTKQPKSLKRIGLKSQAEAKRVERELIVQLEESFKTTVMLTWPKLATQYMESKRLSDWSQKTFENCKLCLEAHTFEKWKGRRVLDCFRARSDLSFSTFNNLISLVSCCSFKMRSGEIMIPLEKKNNLLLILNCCSQFRHSKRAVQAEDL